MHGALCDITQWLEKSPQKAVVAILATMGLNVKLRNTARSLVNGV